MPSFVAIVFPGQGSQRSGMLDALPSSATARGLAEYAEYRTGLPLRSLSVSAGPAQLADTRVAQPLLYVADVTWGLGLLEAGIRPAGLAGHSLGELAALAVSGAIDPRVGVYLVAERSRLMAECAADAPGGMTAVLGMDGAAVAEAVGSIEGVWVANDNAPGQVIISGTGEGVAAASAALEAAGARRLVPLDVAGPYHTPLMGPAKEAFERLLDGVTFADASVPVWQNTDPTPERGGDALRARLVSQITSPVRWTETMRSLAAAGVTTLVEAGPGAVLTGLAKRVEGLTAIAAEQAGLEGVLEEVSSR